MSEHHAAGGHTSCCDVKRQFDDLVSQMGLTVRRKLDPRPVPVGHFMDEMALGQGFSPNTYAFSCQHYSTNAPYSFIPSFIHSFLYSFVYSSIHPSIQPTILSRVLRPSSVLRRLINLQSLNSDFCNTQIWWLSGLRDQSNIIVFKVLR